MEKDQLRFAPEAVPAGIARHEESISDSELTAQSSESEGSSLLKAREQVQGQQGSLKKIIKKENPRATHKEEQTEASGGGEKEEEEEEEEKKQQEDQIPMTHSQSELEYLRESNRRLVAKSERLVAIIEQLLHLLRANHIQIPVDLLAVESGYNQEEDSLLSFNLSSDSSEEAKQD